ncbi:hypothetical protein [Clostridium cellulovorans]|uniref:Uncharacterized protein n=1 Tax=Clostridium cellulovorans (strain ATCC 35296 / DSM 3052 / OCM 3 / 743B) TaxID=573061 RepID=D9SMD0_CLOC7|nr:hypothetical protein [Clostridium cellulovorans]ADL53786.1 hypothetical protein Clocel_4125 [Clostridium cellulovorans 743B]
MKGFIEIREIEKLQQVNGGSWFSRLVKKIIPKRPTVLYGIDF